jgi:hypothetical protein
MKTRWICIGLLIITVWLSGCAVIGRGKDFRPFDEQALTQIKPGQTTAIEVTTLFGAPTQIVRLSNGNAYVYARTLSKATGLWLILFTLVNYDTQHDRIVFFINKSDVVTHYGSSFQAEKAAYGMPF